MSHKNHDAFGDREQFQIERMILFSDAVFAIAITLLVIEVKVPEVPFANPKELAHALLEKWPEFFGVFLSFAVIGQFWTNHHRVFGNVIGYDNKLLWLNMHMLFWVVMVPFTSGLNSKYGNFNLVWEIYSINLFMIGLALFFLYTYLGNPKRNLATFASNPLMKRYSKIRSFSTSFIFLMGALLCLPGNKTLSIMARLIYFLIPVVLMLINRSYKKKIAIHK